MEDQVQQIITGTSNKLEEVVEQNPVMDQQEVQEDQEVVELEVSGSVR
jgi:hypothetical protein